MAQDGQKPDVDSGIGSRQVAIAGILGQVGCLTLIVIAGALVAGLWLDNFFDTRPLFTLILILASVPVTIYLMIRIVLSFAPKLETMAAEGSKKATQEENQVGEHRAEEVSQNH